MSSDPPPPPPTWQAGLLHLFLPGLRGMQRSTTHPLHGDVGVAKIRPEGCQV